MKYRKIIINILIIIICINFTMPVFAESGNGYYKTFQASYGATFKEYEQFIGDYKDKTYSEGSMSASGCGPTAVAIIASAYVDGYNPGAVADIMGGANNGGTTPDKVKTAFETLGIPASIYYNITQDNVKQWLSEGRAFVLSVSGGSLWESSGTGHLFTVLDINPDNSLEAYVSNPGRNSKDGGGGSKGDGYHTIFEILDKPYYAVVPDYAPTGEIRTATSVNVTNSSSNSNNIIKSNENKFLGLWKNNVGYYVPYYNEHGDVDSDAVYKKDGKIVKHGSDYPAMSIIEQADYFFELLNVTERTQSHLKLMKYLMYKYSGIDYGVTEFSYDLFDINGFTSASGVAISGVEGICYNFLVSKGMTKEGACGILGNIFQESGFNQSSVNSIGAIGLCQWLGGRATGLRNYAASKGTEWTDIQTQLEFLWMEIDPEEDKTYANQQILPTDFEKLKNATDVEEATIIFRKKFERCGEAEANDKRRIDAANRYYQQASMSGIRGTISADGTDISTYTSSSGKTYLEYKQDVGSWASQKYGSLSIAEQGCSITSIAIALSGYGYDYTPTHWAGSIKYIVGEVQACAPGSTLTNTKSEESAYLNVQPNHKEDIKAYLKTGNAVIFHVLGAKKRIFEFLYN